MKRKIFNRLDTGYFLLIISAAVTIAVIFIIYGSTQDILKERLRERLTAIAATAALQFTPEEINDINEGRDVNKEALKAVVNKMQKIRDSNLNLRYIYIWKKTDDPNFVKFIADAEMLEPIDQDGNGKIEGAEIPPSPGEPYDISEIPPIEDGFSHAFALQDFIFDKWGTFLSGFAPIRNNLNEKSEIILGMDVQVDDFNKLINATLIPFITLSILLLAILSFQTITLTRIWKSRVELIKELDRQKDELLSIVSHQLATPITSTKWYVEMLLEGDLGSLNKEQREHITSMRSIAADLSDLVSMILDVSRIQLGRMKVEKHELDLQQFFAEILNVIEPKSIQNKIKLITKLPTNLPKAMLDKRYTRMTIENLLSNAIKYTSENGVVEFVVTVDNQLLKCLVRDTGCGIPKEDQAKIFGKLYRASNVRNSVDGNGFGLYVAKGAVEAQGGKIWFESTEGKGTTFFVELPLK